MDFLFDAAETIDRNPHAVQAQLVRQRQLAGAVKSGVVQPRSACCSFGLNRYSTTGTRSGVRQCRAVTTRSRGFMAQSFTEGRAVRLRGLGVCCMGAEVSHRAG